MPNGGHAYADKSADESARLRRLAIVIAAQMPGDPDKARIVMGHLNELVGAYSRNPDTSCQLGVRMCLRGPAPANK